MSFGLVLVTLSRCPRWVLVTPAGDFLLLRFLNVLTDQIFDVGGFAIDLLKLCDDVGVCAVVKLDAEMGSIFRIPSPFSFAVCY